MLTLIGQLMVDGLAMGMVYVILSAGIVFIMSITGIFYLAYGQFYMVGAFATWAAVNMLHLPYGLGLVVAVAITTTMGLISYKLIFQYTTYAKEKFLATIVAAIGLMLILSQSGFILFGSSARSIPVVFPGVTVLAGINITNDKVALMIISVVLILLLFWFYQKTKIGRAMRAVSFNVDASALQGIDTKGICLIAVCIGTGLAGLAGGLIAPGYGIVPEMGANIISIVMLIAMLGGIDSMVGSVLAGIVAGMILSFGQYYMGSYSQIVLFVAVGIIIVFRPGGLLGSKEFGM